MAERRMFSKQIIDSDAFLDMSASAQALYFHLAMRADDDGFINNPRKIQRMIGAADDDLKILIAKRFLIAYRSGVVVIKHWKIHNYIQSDRYRPTVYQDEKAMLLVKDNRAYTEAVKYVGEIRDVSRLDTECVQVVSNLDTQVSIGKSSIVEESIESTRTKAKGAAAPARTQRGEYGWVKLTDEEYARLQADLGEAELDRCIRYVDESAQGTGNKNKWKDWALTIRRCARDKWGVAGAGTSKRKLAFQAYDQGDPAQELQYIDRQTAALLAEARELDGTGG